MKLVPAKCPCCGAELQLNENMVKAYCQCCNSTILVQAAIAFYRSEAGGSVRTNSADFEIVAGVLKKYRGASADVVIPSNVTVIGHGAFSSLMVRSVVIPDSVTEIQYYAFLACKGLTRVSMPSALKIIGESAFDKCENLKNLELPESLGEIGKMAFKGCKSLTQLRIPKSVKRIGESAFEGCSSLRGLSIEGVFKCEQDMNIFSGCKKIENVTINGGSFGVDDCRNIKPGYSYDSGDYACYQPAKGVDFKSNVLANMMDSVLFERLKNKQKKQQKEQWKAEGRCEYCGGRLRGHFRKVCTACGKENTY